MVEDVPSDAEALFAVVDLETTGFSPLVGDKIIEVAIVRVRADGSRADEYVTLVNPLRDVGCTHVHRIGQQDVASAPTFQEILGDVLSRLAGVIMVGHNVRYDRDFLAAELSSAGDALVGPGHGRQPARLTGPGDRPRGLAGLVGGRRLVS